MEYQSRLGKFGQLKNKLIIVGQAVSQSKVKQSAEEHYDVKYFSRFEDFKLTRESNPYSLWVHFDTLLDIQDFEEVSLPSFLLTTTTGITHLGSSLRQRLGERLLSLASEQELLRQVTSTAEHAWSLIMAISNPWIQKLRLDKQLERSDLLRLSQMSSRKIGLIGYGRLGRMVADYALAFGMQVYIHDIDQSIKIPSVKNLQKVESIEEILSICDIVSIHASKILDHQFILSEDKMRNCRKGISIVNTSRGSLVDEHAIVDLLNSNIIEWYATDVLSEEEIGAPMSPTELKERAKNLDGVFITPHIGGANLEAMKLCEMNLLSRLLSLEMS